MAYSVKFKTSAFKEFAALDKPIQKRIQKILDDPVLLENPRLRLVPYEAALAGYWKLRVGDYRLIIDIQDKLLVLEVIKAAHRRKVY